MTSKPTFGFNAGAALAAITPAPTQAGRPTVELKEVDRVAERLGFPSRETPVRRRKRQVAEEPTDQINIRAAITDLNAFIEFCERNRLSYREGFGRLIQFIGEAEKDL
ncbi:MULTISPECIES: hypothetical protein [unclassified Aurantimonas]|uniref:hypothetical protein n=1 Tax=unclassified Aurantimonas TaxID=2638230 RepID=UPI002E1738FE|nr:MULTISPECIES: hypothetical protein [unclassified Aurantimonas]MEC5293497.1 hypothetical protein [Aurantimonas sp. C2-3-R2]MEC5414567.1 hypothetical protein [Aurantimonas sp. C2-4-R8]